MKFIEFVARTYCKEEAAYTAAWVKACAYNEPLNRRDRSRPIWYWALKRWGPDKWPHAEYKARNRKPI